MVKFVLISYIEVRTEIYSIILDGNKQQKNEFDYTFDDTNIKLLK